MASNFSRVIERDYPDVVLNEAIEHLGNKSISDFRIEAINNVNFNSKKINFDMRVMTSAGKKSGRFVDKAIMYMQCECELDEIMRHFKVLDVKDEPQDIRLLKDGVLATPNLVPQINKKDYENEAISFLEAYCPEAVKNTSEVPIVKIATEVLGFKINTSYKLSVYGMLCLSSGYVDTLDGSVYVEANTILVNRDLLNDYGVGCFNNTIAHELYHYFRHRYYFWLRMLALGELPFTIIFEVEDKVKNKYSDTGKIEKQAEQIAPRILMPHTTFINYVWDLQNENNYLFSNTKSVVMRGIVEDAAVFYKTSKQSTAIRIKEIGLFVDPNDLDDYEYENETTKITESQFIHTYENDATFRSLYDSGTFSYIDNHVVLRDAKYEFGGAITLYAYMNQDECMVKFSKTRHYRHMLNSNSLGRLPLQTDLYVSVTSNQMLAKKAKELQLEQIVEEDKYKNLVKSNIDETIVALKEYTGKTLDDIALDSDVRKQDIFDILHGEIKDITVEKAVKILHSFGLPLRYTKIALSKMTDNFDHTMKTRLIEQTLDLHYADDNVVFNQEIADTVKFSEDLIEESKCMRLK